MNIQSKIPRTPAEEAIIDLATSLADQLPGDDQVKQRRNALLNELSEHGLPTRRVEAWHYTDLRRLLNNIPAHGDASNIDAIAPMVDGSHVLALSHGQNISDNLSIDHVSISSVAADFGAGLMSDLLISDGADDTIALLNGVFANGGYGLTIADDAKIETAIEVQLLQSSGHCHTCLPVVFGKNSEATIIERHVSCDAAASMVSCVSHVTVGDGAKATWVIVQAQGTEDTHLAQIKAKLGEGSELHLYVVNAGGKLVRQEIIADVAGSDSNLTLRGVNLLAGDTHTDVTLKLGHTVPNTMSTETFRNVVFDRAKGVFQGQIKVSQIAQKTDAQMACNTLLMSDDADFSAKPELEIFADDVICAHGATVADIDPAHLFYLMARGVSEKTARGLLVKGFVIEVLDDLENDAIKESLSDIISNWLIKHG